jgi:hypothetical protein
MIIETEENKIIGFNNSLKYRWVDNWTNSKLEKGWSHHGLVVNKDDIIITSCASQRTADFYSQTGDKIKSFDLDVIDAHGLSISEQEGVETLWVTDAGKRRNVGGDFNYPKLYDGKVVQYSLEGKKLCEIDKSMIPDYNPKRTFSPTVSEINKYNGDIWITDGYSSQNIFCFNSTLNYKCKIDSSKIPYSFNCPHWIYIDYRKNDPELLVADRMNHRIQVFDMEGHYIRTFAENITNTPTVFSIWEDYLIVGELEARILLFDKHDQYCGELGNGREYTELKGWPNRLGENKKPTRANDLVYGKFNSPHGCDTDSKGNIYVAEWLIGGRLTKLERC